MADRQDLCTIGNPQRRTKNPPAYNRADDEADERKGVQLPIAAPSSPSAGINQTSRAPLAAGVINIVQVNGEFEPMRHPPMGFVTQVRSRIEDQA
jgi:hypothetical protein